MKRKRPIITCVNCGREKEHRAKGLCAACWQYQFDNGVPRPAHVYDPAPRSKVRPCANCGHEERIVARELCRNCYNHQHRHGVPRPPEVIYRVPAPRYCQRCKQARTVAHGRCGACLWWWKMHGRERPAHRYQTDAPCRNCKAPRAAFPDSRRWSNGLCHTCYTYRARHHKHRPAELIERAAPLGWCECGALAVTVRPFEIPLGKGHTMRYEEKLCARCEREEEAA